LTAEDVGKGNLFIGKSAGAKIAALSIEYAKKKEDIRLLTPDFYNFAGFDIVDFYPVPHFNMSHCRLCKKYNYLPMKSQ